MYNALKAYQQTQVQRDVNPVKLIHMAYKGILTYLEKAEEGIDEGNIQKRGENLSRAIALITELNVALRSSSDSPDEAGTFLRGLYETILVELPKVSITDDKEILHRAHRYITRLKETWEETAMPQQGETNSSVQPSETENISQQPYQAESSPKPGLSTSV